jgi:hypothetical protein
MHGTNQGSRDQTSFVRFCEEAISELAIPELRDVERGRENDFAQVALTQYPCGFSICATPVRTELGFVLRRGLVPRMGNGIRRGDVGAEGCTERDAGRFVIALVVNGRGYFSARTKWKSTGS